MSYEEYRQVEFLKSIGESRERLRQTYEAITGERELEKGLIQILKAIMTPDELA